jgi:poly(hydroxyalkanoate) depolymerase family esterase
VLAVWPVLLPSVTAAAPGQPAPGHTTAGTVISNGDAYNYLLYTPTSYHPRRAAPLLVMVHGCQTTAAQMLTWSDYDPLADREGFAVLYPDVDAFGRSLPGPANQCWRFPYPAAWKRGSSDAAAIADMTRAAMAKLNIDPERVYLIGTSAGGLMASIDAAAYPDLYAAVGVVEGAGYADWPCFTNGVGIPVTTSAQMAFEAMGPRARVVPIFVTGSTGDQAFPPNCANKALEQQLRTDNLVIGGSQTGPLALTPASIRRQQRPGGDGYTVSGYRDPDGCLIGEKWIIDGMPHGWPGGAQGPVWAKAPSASDGSWAFFRHFTKSETSMPCAEARAPGPPSRVLVPQRCAGRWLLIRLPADVSTASATVNGRRAFARKTRAGVRVRLPAGDRARTTVVVTARTRAGRRLARHYTYRGCGR